MDGTGTQREEMGEENPMERILEQLQRDNFSHAPGEEMTHVAGVSFVDNVGLSLGAAPREEADHAGAYRHIANCANALESLVLDEEDAEAERERERLERERRARQGAQQAQQGEQDYSYQNHQYQHQHSGDRWVHSSTRLRGEDRHIVLERSGHNQVAAVVLKQRPEHDDSEEAQEEGESSSS
eukprot:g7463.t1